jgi:formyltetrahydrofolate deformylase
MEGMEPQTLILKLNCPDSVGLLAKISGFFAAHGGNFIEVQQYTDPLSRWFFTRMQIEPSARHADPAELAAAFEPLAGSLRAEWTLRPSNELVRMVLLASREEHCLAEMLWRRRCGELRVEIPVIISNHENCAALAKAEGIPFAHVPMKKHDREEGFRTIADLKRVGRDCERLALARGVRFHIEDRVLIHGPRASVFRD